MTDAPDKIQWHPSFHGATGYEFKKNKHDIQIVSEYNLSKQPLRIDILIVKRNEGKEPVKLENDDKANADAILQASISANYELYKEVREEHVMCEALERLMKDKIDEKLDEKYNMGILDGKREGILDGKIDSIKNIIVNLSCTPEQAMDLIGIHDSQRELVLSRL